jgi:SAM-dependent methyltransferase
MIQGSFRERTEMGVDSRAFDPRRILSYPRIYRAFQRMVRSNRPRLIEEILKIQPGQRVLDIGCGPADILRRLPPNIEYCGFDMEPRYIEEARQRYGNRGSFFVRAVTPDAIDDLGKFDVVMSLGVLHHLNDRDADTVLASAAKVLRSGGRLITLDGAYVKGQNPVARLLLMMDRGRHVRTPAAYLEIARRHFSDPKASVIHDLHAIPYTLCVIEATRPQRELRSEQKK